MDIQWQVAVVHGSFIKGYLPWLQPAAPAAADEDDDDSDVDLFASDDEEEESAEAAKIREERLAAYAAKKSKKPALIAKSMLILDVSIWWFRSVSWNMVSFKTYRLLWLSDQSMPQVLL